MMAACDLLLLAGTVFVLLVVGSLMVIQHLRGGQ